MRKFVSIIIVLQLSLFLSCNKTINLLEMTPALSDSYGYSEDDPVKVGGFDRGEGPRREQQYLYMLCGPNGEVLHFTRMGSCCFFKRSFLGGYGLLDKYALTHKGIEDTLYIYLDMYRTDGIPKVPKGLRLIKP